MTEKQKRECRAAIRKHGYYVTEDGYEISTWISGGYTLHDPYGQSVTWERTLEAIFDYV